MHFTILIDVVPPVSQLKLSLLHIVNEERDEKFCTRAFVLKPEDDEKGNDEVGIKKRGEKKNGFTETRTQDPVCVRHM